MVNLEIGCELMKNIKLTVEFDGTNYAGWQRQKNALAIQEVLESSITRLTGEKSEVFGSSRTDSGVHAKEYVCNFFTESSIPPEKFKDALNVRLPLDIVITASDQASDKFHSRYDSIGKMYSYTILNRANRPAMFRNYVYHYRAHIDIDSMGRAAQYFIGKKDFAAFRNLGSSAKTTIREIKDLHIERIDDLIKIYISADGFLYNMARIIAGTLLNVGTGKIQPAYVEQILNSKNRKLAGKALPACGLCLEKVFYEND